MNTYSCVIFFLFWMFLSIAPACEVVGVGAPIIDLLMPISEKEISIISGTKNGSLNVDWETFKAIRSLGEDGRLSLRPGGSTSNTIRVLAHLGKRCALVGKIGQDMMGKRFLDHLTPLGVEPRFFFSLAPTSQVICLITPDGERTMRAFAGASLELVGKDLSPDLFRGAKLVHIEGYALYNDHLVEHAMRLAKESGALVSFDMGCHEVATQFRDTVIDLLRKYVDIAFANEEETYNLTGCSTPEEGCKQLHEHVSVAVVLTGENGCCVGHGNQVFRCPTKPLCPVDCTGAGDFFAGGFLYGVLNGSSYEECAAIGNLLGGAVIEYIGAEIPEERWFSIQKEILDLSVTSECD